MDGTYVAIGIDNRRHQDLGNGAPPPLRSGFNWVIDISGPVFGWALVFINVTGLASMLFPADAETDLVDIAWID